MSEAGYDAHRNLADEIAQETDDQEKHDGGKVEPPHVGQESANRLQRGLHNGVQSVPDGPDHLIVKIDYVERDQPGHDRDKDDRPGVKPQDIVDQVEYGAHLNLRKGWSRFSALRPARQEAGILGASSDLR